MDSSSQFATAPPALGPRRTERLRASEPADLRRAAEILRAGGTVAFPTETVYGLGANALNQDAVAKIFEAKQRPSWDPLIVHVTDREQLPQLTIAPLGGRNLRTLMDRFWPGPLTLLLPRTAAVPDAVTSGRPLVGIRIPAHPVARELLRLASVPVAAPSANRFGHTSPTTAEHVVADLDGRIDAVLDGGPTEVGLESTVVELKLAPDHPEAIVYRPGAVTPEMLQEALGPQVPVRIFQPETIADPTLPEALPSPGVGIRHYAPRARLVLVPPLPEPELKQTMQVRAKEHPGERLGCLLPEGWHAPSDARTYTWGNWHDLDILARRLFAGLRALDDAGASVILAPLPPASGLGAALRDRLEKAARPRGPA